MKTLHLLVFAKEPQKDGGSIVTVPVQVIASSLVDAYQEAKKQFQDSYGQSDLSFVKIGLSVQEIEKIIDERTYDELPTDEKIQVFSYVFGKQYVDSEGEIIVPENFY